MNVYLSSVATLLLLAGCQSTSADALNSGSDQPAARGVIAADESAPAGVSTWTRPQWLVGDRFTLVRGERMRGTFEVMAVDDGIYVIDMGNGRSLRRDHDLGNLGEWLLASGQPQRVMSPVDTRYHWPLWVGKRWQCEFVDRVRDGQALVMHASYLVEGMDRVEVPAGTFDALRIMRTLRLAVGGEKFLTRTQVIWFAPDPGIEVRQLLGDTMVELVEFTRK